MKAASRFTLAVAILFVAGYRGTAEDKKEEPKKDGITWSMEHAEKTYGVKLKSATVNEQGTINKIVLVWEFTKDTDGVGEIKRAFGPLAKDMVPTLTFYVFDGDGVALFRNYTEKLEGELTGKKGDAFRTVLNGFTSDVKKTVKKVKARPTPIEKK